MHQVVGPAAPALLPSSQAKRSQVLTSQPGEEVGGLRRDSIIGSMAAMAAWHRMSDGCEAERKKKMVLFEGDHTLTRYFLQGIKRYCDTRVLGYPTATWCEKRNQKHHETSHASSSPILISTSRRFLQSHSLINCALI